MPPAKKKQLTFAANENAGALTTPRTPQKQPAVSIMYIEMRVMKGVAATGLGYIGGTSPAT